MYSRTHPSLNPLKKINKEDRCPRPRPSSQETKMKQKRKRLGEIYVTTDNLDRLTLQASTVQTHSDDEEALLKSHCFTHLPSTQSGPSVHLCWQFDDTHHSEVKSAELINAIGKVVKILKSLDAESDDDELPGTARESELKNGVAPNSTHENGIPEDRAYHQMKVPGSLKKEPQNDHGTREDDREKFVKNGMPEDRAYHQMKFPSKKEPQKDYGTREDDCEKLLNPDQDRTRSTSRPKCKAFKTAASTFETMRCTPNRREAYEHASPSKGIREARESKGNEFSTHDHSDLQGSAAKFPSGYNQAPDEHQPEDTMPPEDVQEHSGKQGAEREGPSIEEPSHDLFTSRKNKEPESGSESATEHSDCEIGEFDTDSPSGFRNIQANDLKNDSDEEMDKTGMHPVEESPEEEHDDETPRAKTCCHELEIQGRDCAVNMQCEEDEYGSGSEYFGLPVGDEKRENMVSITSDLEEKSPATSIDIGKSRVEYFLQTDYENTNGSSSNSSEDSLLYEDEQMFHDSVREQKGRSSKFNEVFRMKLMSGVDISEQIPMADHELNGHGYENRQDISRSRPRRIRPRHRYEVETLPEVDRIFDGPRWKTFDPRVRVKTILDQYHYLISFYRSEASMKDRVKKCRSRPDILAGKYLMAKRFCFNQGWSVIGNIPGVEVGDTFMYREELLILIVHRTSQAGIEYIPAHKSGFFDQNGRPLAVAVSVVSSGGYKDNADDGQTLTYVGSGGQKNMTSRRVSPTYSEKDQELVRGNLALKNSCDLGVPVRVVRGEKYADGEKSYWYDGLYDVVKCYEEVGSAGSKVWKFQLVKQKGQRES